jgi:glucosamine kinase
MSLGFDYLVGIDGGGSGTRVRLARPDGSAVGFGSGGPSALMGGVEAAWRAIKTALAAAFTAAGVAPPASRRLAVGLGVAGATHQPWVDALRQSAPEFCRFEIESDAYTALLGAHGGQPGAVVAIGTGSVGMAEDANGLRRFVGGWGFPAGDEASGAWMGLRAVAHAEQVSDGRRDEGPLARAVIRAAGEEGLRAWVVRANQNRYASLAPLVLAHAHSDGVARAIVVDAAAEAARLATALDPQGQLPLAWCGGLAAPLQPFLPHALQERSRPPMADSATGALLLVARQLGLAWAPLVAHSAGEALERNTA